MREFWKRYFFGDPLQVLRAGGLTLLILILPFLILLGLQIGAPTTLKGKETLSLLTLTLLLTPPIMRASYLATQRSKVSLIDVFEKPSELLKLYIIEVLFLLPVVLLYGIIKLISPSAPLDDPITGIIDFTKSVPSGSWVILFAWLVWGLSVWSLSYFFQLYSLGSGYFMSGVAIAADAANSPEWIRGLKIFLGVVLGIWGLIRISSPAFTNKKLSSGEGISAKTLSSGEIILAKIYKFGLYKIDLLLLVLITIIALIEALLGGGGKLGYVGETVGGSFVYAYLMLGAGVLTGCLSLVILSEGVSIFEAFRESRIQWRSIEAFKNSNYFFSGLGSSMFAWGAGWGTSAGLTAVRVLYPEWWKASSGSGSDGSLWDLMSLLPPLIIPLYILIFSFLLTPIHVALKERRRKELIEETLSGLGLQPEIDFESLEKEELEWLRKIKEAKPEDLELKDLKDLLQKTDLDGLREILETLKKMKLDELETLKEIVKEKGLSVGKVDESYSWILGSSEEYWKKRLEILTILQQNLQQALKELKQMKAQA